MCYGPRTTDHGPGATESLVKAELQATGERGRSLWIAQTVRTATQSPGRDTRCDPLRLIALQHTHEQATLIQAMEEHPAHPAARLQRRRPLPWHPLLVCVQDMELH